MSVMWQAAVCCQQSAGRFVKGPGKKEKGAVCFLVMLKSCQRGSMFHVFFVLYGVGFFLPGI